MRGCLKWGYSLVNECVSSMCEEVMADDFATPELRRQKQDDRERRCLVDKQFSATNWDPGFRQEGRVAKLGKEED